MIFNHSNIINNLLDSYFIKISRFIHLLQNYVNLLIKYIVESDLTNFFIK